MTTPDPAEIMAGSFRCVDSTAYFTCWDCGRKQATTSEAPVRLRCCGREFDWFVEHYDDPDWGYHAFVQWDLVDVVTEIGRMADG